MILNTAVHIFFIISVFYLIFGLDDLFIDAVAWIRQAFPKEIKEEEKTKIYHLPEKRIAILVAAWKEEGVITPMIRGNSENLQYKNYDFYLGVYPNDEQTLQEALQLSLQYRHVHVVVNSRKGPTSKGQMLNEMVDCLTDRQAQKKYDILMIHDAEDIIHPLSLKIINWRTRFSDFVQIPVFALQTPQTDLVAGLYADEFAESHTKDVLVRQLLGAPIPSAGVGTAMTKKYVHRLRHEQNGNLFNPDTVTEDYQLGLMGDSIGLKTEFACYYFLENKVRNYIATHEYFPKSFSASVRQRSRWILGIAFQGYRALGWRGSWVHKYFLFRDRKGPIASVMGLVGLLLMAPTFLYFSDTARMAPSEWLVLAPLNFLFAGNRVVQRFLSIERVYGLQATLLILPRLLVGNVINAFATFRAAAQHAKYVFNGQAPAWSKTTHEMPAGFGEHKLLAFPMKSSIVLVFCILATVFSLPSAALAKPFTKSKICLFYDDLKGDHQMSNENDALLLFNLLGHFPKFVIQMQRVQAYQDGDLKHCEAGIYMGGIFDTPLGDSFLKDVANFKKSFLWIGYNIWKLQNYVGLDSFKKNFGFSYLSTEGFSKSDGEPDFYRYFSYKGETFEKALLKKDLGYAADPSIVLVANIDAQVLAEAIYSQSSRKTPYILNKQRFFYVADRAFTYIHEADRYLIVADILFDFLQQPAKPGPHRAIVRLEDVSPYTDLSLLNKTIEVFKKRKANFAMSVIPKFISAVGSDGSRQTITLLQKPEFLLALQQAQKAGGTVLLHGYTHQMDGVQDCPALASGLDYEFWDRCRAAPLTFDSEAFVRGRLESALDLLKQAHLVAAAWVTPHYSASALDFKIFGKTFAWTLQRVLYVMDGNPKPDYGNSQFFPYTIYNDYYGQHALPENLGYQSDSDPKFWAQRILKNSKRNLVLRDAWASFFWHPYLASDLASLNALDSVVEQMQSQGYVFADLKKGVF